MTEELNLNVVTFFEKEGFPGKCLAIFELVRDGEQVYWKKKREMTGIISAVDSNLKKAMESYCKENGSKVQGKFSRVFEDMQELKEWDLKQFEPEDFEDNEIKKKLLIKRL